MKWVKRIEVARTSPEVYRRVRASPSESEAREDFGVTGRGSDAKRVVGKERETKGNERERRGTKGMYVRVHGMKDRERNEEEGRGTGE